MSYPYTPPPSSAADEISFIGNRYLRRRKALFAGLFWLSLIVWLSTFVLNLAQYGTFGLYLAALLYLAGVTGTLIFGLWFIHARRDATSIR